MLLKQNDCEPEFLFEKDFEYYISGVFKIKFVYSKKIFKF